MLSDERILIEQIRDVTFRDRGWYDCQVNTEPKISNKSFLSVSEDPRGMRKQKDSPAQTRGVLLETSTLGKDGRHRKNRADVNNS